MQVTSFQLAFLLCFRPFLLSLSLLHVQIIALRLYVNIVTQLVTQNKFLIGLFYILDALSSNLNSETGFPG
jgi:hypothetical protein